MGKVIIIVGGAFGDEGKGKIVDFLAEKADVVARATGGNNAGHTVVIGDETYKFHLIPSGIVHKDKLNICGNGMVIDPAVFVGELKKLEEKGYKITDKQLVVSSSAHVILPEHIEEDKRTGGKIGTTARGIGPCYRDKIVRTGLRMSEFVKRQSKEAEIIRPLVKDTYPIINEAISAGKNVLVEGAQGTMLDIDHGTYPYVTSSNPTAGGACTGLGIGPTKIDKVIAILKAYTTRVGGGPFPTELGTAEQTKAEGTWDKIKPYFEDARTEALERANDNDKYHQGKYMRLQGREYGTTTGRPRRTGWFDGVVAKYAVMINGLSSAVLTKLDVLTGLEKLKLCTHYELDGKKIENFPTDLDVLSKCRPVYEELDGWSDDLSKAAKFDSLPAAAKTYVKRLQKLIGIPLSIVSVGPERTQTIVLKREELF
ncbi:adenylosuccinate synthetase [Candidatus Woesearchaeota archaeon]|nr:adenylosuccinate synthetase [Candidatus Woesearchaeota archaeon]